MVDCVAQLLGDGVTTKGLHIEVVCLGREDQERHDGDITACRFQEVVQPGERLNEDVRALVAELVSAGDEEVQGFVQVEVEMPVEVTAHELVQLLLRHGVEVLELVQRRELLDIQPIRRDEVRLALQQMLRFVARDLRDSREDV